MCKLFYESSSWLKSISMTTQHIRIFYDHDSNHSNTNSVLAYTTLINAHSAPLAIDTINTSSIHRISRNGTGISHTFSLNMLSGVYLRYSPLLTIIRRRGRGSFWNRRHHTRAILHTRLCFLAKFATYLTRLCN